MIPPTTSSAADPTPSRPIDLDAFEGRLRGRLVRPGSEPYEQHRRVHNTLIDRRPFAIVRVVDVADVARAIDLARATGLPLAVRSGGHSVAGHGTVDGGIVVDLSLMRNLREHEGKIGGVLTSRLFASFADKKSFH